MKIDLPIYIEKRQGRDGSSPVYSVSPLFSRVLEGFSVDLAKAMGNLLSQIRRHVDELTRERRFDLLLKLFPTAQWTDHSQKITLDLGKQTIRARLHVVNFQIGNCRMAFTPTVPDLWFKYNRGENLRQRTEEVLGHHYRNKAKAGMTYDSIANELAGRLSTWTTTAEINIHPSVGGGRRQKQTNPFAMLGGGRTFSGETELFKVGRCLDFRYPDDLDRVVGRDREVDKLLRHLDSEDKPPVLLVGSNKVGKTAIIHEAVYRQVDQRGFYYSSQKSTWLINPQRLISGMSFVGEWEDRLLAIVKTAAKLEHTLYFDDVLGLFHAGVCGSSDMSVAQVLKPIVERNEFRFLGETTPEGFHILQEKDRGFADLFQVIRVEEPDEATNCRMLIWTIRRLEAKYGCQFDGEVLPTVVELHRRYVQGISFPGKAAMFLEKLAVSHRSRPIHRADVLEIFRDTSGLSVTFMDTRKKLARKDVLLKLRGGIIGQDAAVETMADVVSLAKARLNEPGRPLGTLLFLGPTGVGKTQCAKTLAAYLFGSDDRLLRFDMNEFVSADAVARLVGTFHTPEGLLTSAIRRQPFAVVLFDEIEKSNPDIFGMLLQVMGEGRLTDAVGRNVDFSNAIIILTSNLGSRQAGKGLGFSAKDGLREGGYVEAAEKFFAPEFFNRLDHVVPFAQLSREEVSRIATMMIKEVLNRSGLTRRNCLLDVHPPAMDRIVDIGFHPELGARALKRAIERQVTLRLARQLAGYTESEGPTIIRIFGRADELLVDARPIPQAKPLHLRRPGGSPDEVGRLGECATAAVHRINRLIAPFAPREPFVPDELSPHEYHYFLIREQLGKINSLNERLLEKWSDARRRLGTPPAIARRGRLHALRDLRDYGWGSKRSSVFSVVHAADMLESVKEIFKSAIPETSLEAQCADLFDELALLEAMVSALKEKASCRVALYCVPMVDAEAYPIGTFTDFLVLSYVEAMEMLWLNDVETVGVPGEMKYDSPSVRLAAGMLGVDSDSPALLPVLAVSGLHARNILRNEVGSILFLLEEQRFVPVQLVVGPVLESQGIDDIHRESLRAREQWAQNLATGKAELADDPLPIMPATRLVVPNWKVNDIRSGEIVDGTMTARDLRHFILSSLPLPPELSEFESAAEKSEDPAEKRRER